MTKYILNSGGLRKFPEKAVKFYGEMVKDLGEKPHILHCLFAQKREDWEEKFEQYTSRFQELSAKEIKATHELAFPDKFVEQVKNADVINMCGGDDHLVQYWLKQFDLKEMFKGKVVSTNSASSAAMTTHFWTCDWRMCLDGLGILPIKFIPHYKSDWGENDPRGPIDWGDAYKELAEYGKDLPIYALEEGDYEVFEVE